MIDGAVALVLRDRSTIYTSAVVITFATADDKQCLCERMFLNFTLSLRKKSTEVKVFGVIFFRMLISQFFRCNL